MNTNTLDANLIEERQPVTDAMVASGGKRLLNYIIDYIAMYVLLFILGFIGGSLSLVSNSPEEANMILGFVFLLFFPAYYVLMEHYTGKTIGKYLTKTRVVDMDGNKPTLGKATLRTLCRIIPFEAFSFLGSPCVGWHDSITKTRVIDDK